jgi:hypothetical protein
MVKEVLVISEEYNKRGLIIKPDVIIDPVYKTDMFDEVILKRKFNPKPGDKVFITSKCSIPRAKVKIAFKDLGIKITHDLDAADHIVVDNNFMYHNTDTLYGYLYPAEGALRLVNDMTEVMKQYKKSPGYVKESLDHVLSFCEIILKNPGKDFMINYKMDSAIYDVFEMDYEDENHYASGEKYNRRPRKGMEDFFRSLGEKIDKFVPEGAIISSTNSDIVLDDRLMESLDKMFESADKENVSLAMETMANCNHEKSALNLLLLIKEHKIKMGDSRASSHVNFKSLLKYFNLSRWDLIRGHFDYDKLITILKRKDLLTPEYIAILTPLVLDKMIEDYSTDYFKIKEIEFVDKKEDDKNY